jgi:hypothetical protein
MLEQVQPYHQVGARKHGGVYHDRSDCPQGRRVRSDQLAAGARGLPYCDACRALTQRATVTTTP